MEDEEMDEATDQSDRAFNIFDRFGFKGQTSRKRQKLMSTTDNDAVNVFRRDNGTGSETLPKMCEICSQYSNQWTIIMDNLEETEFVDEMSMLQNTNLRVVDDEEGGEYQITDFSITDCFGHACPVDTGLVEENIKLFINGYVKPIFDDNPATTGGIATRNIGPISQWWCCGYDGGAKPLIGLSTDRADYYLLAPNPLYEPFIKSALKKAYLIKCVIELLSETPQSSYKHLLDKIEATNLPCGMKPFTEATLLRYAAFVVDSVISYDAAGESGDNPLADTPSIQRLINLSKITLEERRQNCVSNRGRLIGKASKLRDSRVITTPLVKQIFEKIFRDQIDDRSPRADTSHRRCGICDNCQKPDCGFCIGCLTMVKFGGPGTPKQDCLQKKCQDVSVRSQNVEEEKEVPVMPTLNRHSRKIFWVGYPIASIKNRTYFKSVNIDNEEITLGDCVFVLPRNQRGPNNPARVIYMWEDEKTMTKFFHAHMFYRGSETVLGELTATNEFFIVDSCADFELQLITCKCQILYKPPPSDWSRLGGLNILSEVVDEKQCHFQKMYIKDTAVFKDPPECYINFKTINANPRYCPCCKRIDDQSNKQRVILGKKLYDNFFESVTWNDKTYFVERCVFLTPDAFTFDVTYDDEQASEDLQHFPKIVDEELYTEYYRKTNTSVKDQLMEPFKIGYVTKIICSNHQSIDSVLQPNDVVLKIKKFYRPEDTRIGPTEKYKSDFNIVHWSDEEAFVELCLVRGMCNVLYYDEFENKEQLWQKGPEYFYFTKKYDGSLDAFVEVRETVKLVGNQLREKLTFQESFAVSNPPLRTMDIFCGVGGLSEGLQQAKVSETRWAVDNNKEAAFSFKLNNNKCTVYNENSNTLLDHVINDDETTCYGLRLPNKGDVELLCGGPPCQGFSSMNRFTSRDYSSLKNSLVVSFLSYCDFFRPRFILFENIRDFVTFEKSMILKLTIYSLVSMNYQCRFGVLQAGNFGVPQSRRRVFIFAAAPGEELPAFPEIRHSFSFTDALNTTVDGHQFGTGVLWTKNAPYRQVTVHDSLADLPPIISGATLEEMPYNPSVRAHYQRILQGPKCPQSVRDHVCKTLMPLTYARVQLIPSEPNADWRDLPNKIVLLSDGTLTNKLEYTTNDPINGKSTKGQLRGVCGCAATGQCSNPRPQENTLIPWCLPHTGNNYNNWSGLYGRLNPNGWFRTTVTNPKPMGKQGRVLHPTENRVVSVRECARSQGFPDSYRFYGDVIERHKQIGNAVPPPLAAAIGLEYEKCHVKKIKIAHRRGIFENLNCDEDDQQ